MFVQSSMFSMQNHRKEKNGQFLEYSALPEARFMKKTTARTPKLIYLTSAKEKGQWFNH
jgi:hypothetical protein